jgi:hypothetical protein
MKCPLYLTSLHHQIRTHAQGYFIDIKRYNPSQQNSYCWQAIVL